MIYEPLEGLYLVTILHFSGFVLRKKIACITKVHQNYEATDEQKPVSWTRTIINDKRFPEKLWPRLVTITETLITPDITKPNAIIVLL